MLVVLKMRAVERNKEQVQCCHFIFDVLPCFLKQLCLHPLRGDEKKKKKRWRRTFGPINKYPMAETPITQQLITFGQNFAYWAIFLRPKAIFFKVAQK